MYTRLRLSGRQYEVIRQHLFPGDDKEAVAVALCGVGERVVDGIVHRVVCIYDLALIPYEDCTVRTHDRVTWKTDRVVDLLQPRRPGTYCVMKIHSHPNGLRSFSEHDDIADMEFLPSVSSWLDTHSPGVSCIMLPDGDIRARSLNSDNVFESVDSVLVAGPDIRLWTHKNHVDVHQDDQYNLRTVQTFGIGTVSTLKNLSCGVVGVSGTGSPVCEMLHRLGIGHLVLVDGDKIEEKNIGRIYNSTMRHANEKIYKVAMMKDSIENVGTDTTVTALPHDLYDPSIVRQLAQCDVIFGCMDTVDGRHILNRLCTFYSIPYFDLGVHLDADGRGGVDQVCGTVHYLQPDGSSLLSRRVYTIEQLKASDLRRTDPNLYQMQVKEKYIRGVQEDRPAVISVNTLIASLAVNELLARLHGFRDDPNSSIGSVGISLTQTRFILDEEGEPCSLLSREAGRGDMVPLLNMSVLSERG